MEGSSHYIANRIFSPNVIKGIYDVIAPMYPDINKAQQSFFPDEAYTTDEAIAYFQHNFWGMTPPTALGADPMPVGIPGGFYKSFAAGYFGEYSRFESKDLVQVKDPTAPYKADGITPNLWGEGMMRNAMAHQKHRFETFKEAFCGALIGAGNFHIFGDGIDRYFPGPSSTDYILEPHYRLSAVSAGTVSYGGWTTGGTWATAATATPIKDINQMILYLAQTLGVQVTEIWMSTLAAQRLIDADETTSWIEKNPELSRTMLATESAAITINKVVSGDVKFVVDDRTYAERMVIKTPTVENSSTTVVVDNDAPLPGADGAVSLKVMFHTADGVQRLVTITDKTANTLTFAASDLSDVSMQPGDFIVYNKRFVNDDKLIFKTTRTDLQKFASLPCQTSPEDTLSPGVHVYSQEFVKKPNWGITAGTFARTSPIIWGPGGWATLEVF